MLGQRGRSAGGDGARAARAATARGRPPGGVAATAARGTSPPLLLFLFFFFPFSSSIDRRRPILAVPPGSDRSAYRSAVGPVCTGRYGSYRSVRKTFTANTFSEHHKGS
ncbi:hypothetical protein BHM03_00026201 [Ensete ventricosum]|nr:hypothetical protein BHM03_00026201 [Ensete ventricosum]